MTAALAALPAGGGAGVQVAGVDDPGDERPGLLRVPAPVAAPRVLGPDRAGDDGEGPQRERERDDAVREHVEPVDSGSAAREPVEPVRSPAARAALAAVGDEVEQRHGRRDGEDAGEITAAVTWMTSQYDCAARARAARRRCRAT